MLLYFSIVNKKKLFLPQLDFFTFSHQFLFLILCFSGLYYFNLLVLFPKIRWFEGEKIFFLKFISYDIYFFDRWALGVITMQLNSYRYFLLEHAFRMYQLLNSSFVKNIGFSEKECKKLNSKKLFLIFSISVLIFLFFLKNILIFNAEKLMFIYFLLVIIILYLKLKDIFKFLLKEDLKKLINSIFQMELCTEQYIIWMKKIAKGMKLYILGKTKYSFIFNLLKIKQLKLKNVKI